VFTPADLYRGRNRIVPLGYRVEERKLLVEPEEAATVRLIFELYLTLGSLSALQRELRDRGVRTRLRTLATGRWAMFR
jgi:site-specific DNA recombinase